MAQALLDALDIVPYWHYARDLLPSAVSVPIGFERRAELIARDPSVFYLKPHYEPYPIVLIRLNRITRAELERVLRLAHHAVPTGEVVPGRAAGA